MTARVLPLLQGLPVFAVPAGRIEFLHEPAAYLSRLQALIASARQRVSLSGLYLGTDERSRLLVEAATTRLDAPAAPTFALLFDHGRGTRLENGSTSVRATLPLLQRGATLALWQAPRLRGPLARWLLPARFNELLGVQHVKVHVIDDVVIMSGANLSRTYFTDRQDRYVVVRDVALSNFCHTLLGTVARHSASVSMAGHVRPSPTTDLAGDLRQLWKRSASDAPAVPTGDTDTVYVAPTVQLGVCGLRIDEELTGALLRTLPSWSRAAVATGYFNLTDKYADLLREAGPSTTLLVASGTANPWANSRGMSRHVPAAYATLQAAFLESLHGSSSSSSGASQAPLMREWTRDNWSFHCKGVWAFDDASGMALTTIGSANMGHRSVEYDLEAQFLMVSAGAAFATAARAELANIERYCGAPVTAAQMRDAASKLPAFWRATLPLLRRYM